MQPDLDSPSDLVSLRKAETLNRLRRVGHLMDNAVQIPGVGYRVGIDPILGLIPGAGDTVSLIISAYIVVEAARFGLSSATLLRMMINILLETLIGTVPLVGDAVDFVWKSNAQNLALLEAHLQQPHVHKAADRRFVALVMAVLAILILGAIAVTVVIVRGLMALFAG